MKKACLCKPKNDNTSNERATGSTRNQPYSIVTTFVKDFSKDTSEEMKIELLREAVIEGRNFIQQLEPKQWKISGSHDVASAYEKKGTFSQTYRCRYRDVADCNARIRLYGLVTDVSVEVRVSWWQASSAHMMQTSGFFSSSDEHAAFIHVRLPKGKNGADSANLIPLEVQSFIDDQMKLHPNVTPLELVNLVTSRFKYDVAQENAIFLKIMNYRKTIKKNSENQRKTCMVITSATSLHGRKNILSRK